MAKQLKDYLPFYLGCEVFIFPISTVSDGWLSDKIEKYPTLQYKIPLTAKNLTETIVDGYFPILCPLSDILSLTLDQKQQLLNAGLMYSHADDKYTIWTPEAVRLACSFSIDVFNLIDDGLAINKADL